MTYHSFKMSSFNDRTPTQEVASPMTNLANSLGTKLTVRRRLTLSESSETPKKYYDNVLQGKIKYSFNFSMQVYRITFLCKSVNIY